MSNDNIPKYYLHKIQEAKEKQLETLDLSYSTKTENTLVNLLGTVFSDRGKPLTKIPEEVFELKHIKVLNLSGNSIDKLPESIGTLSNLTQLILSNNQLESLPESIGKLSNLTQLILSNNQLGSLPESIGKLSNLTQLSLGFNRLTRIPESIGKLSNLMQLSLSNNQLITLPKSIGKLSNLTQLFLSENQLKYLPESIGNLSNLTQLFLSENQLKYLPESIGNLSNLIQLFLLKNQLANLPKSIGNLSNLTKLSLSKNQLTGLPESISNLSNLTDLYLWANPVVVPPIEVVNQGTNAIKKYFQQLKESGEDYIYEAKLLIVGEAGAGKTSLAKKIKDPQYQLQEKQPSTEGIDVIKWSFPLDNEQEFKVNIWDFGGQAIYHATHQFFLTRRSLYTLVADSRKEDTDFYFWLNVVEQLSDNSPLLIIKNEKQERQREINELALRGQFTNLEKTLATNLATNRGLEEIVSNIQDYIKKLPQIGQVLPKTWVRVRKFLETDDRNYISLTEFFEICQDNGLTRHDDQLQLSRYLHDLGVCLHFQDEEDSLLYKTVILKPEWGTDAVYKVLDNKQVIDSQGHFTRNDLKNIWQDEKYASRRGELLELMKKFQLCYEIPGKKDTFIAPQLLSDKQPEYEWDKAHNLILRYAYPDFMPKGIVSRFIVVMHQYIDQQQYVWKTGVILNKDNTKAEVIEYYGKREIKIRIVGSYKRELLNNVTYELDKIHDSYKRLKYSKLMPCNCHQCKDSQSPYFYPFDTLRKFIADKQYNIQCQKSYEMVNVLSLIDDVVDFSKLISEDKQKSNQSVNIEQFNSISGDVQELLRKIMMDQGNYNERIERDYIDKSRKVNISDKAQVQASGAGAFNLGEISGTVANTINQLPTSPDPEKPGIKELLNQLQKAIEAETRLDDADKSDALEEVQNLAQASQDHDQNAKKTKAGKSLRMLGRIAKGLPATAALLNICKELLPAIAKFFE